MEIPFKKHLMNDDSLLQHLVIQGLSETDEITKVAENPEYVKNGILNIRMTVNDVEIDIERFCEHWQSQVERMLKEKANAMLEDKFNEIDDVFKVIKIALAKKLDIEIKNPWDC